ncbi:TPA: Tn3 family transposase, partial [Escherichia coli]
GQPVSGGPNDTSVGEISVKTGNNARNGGKNSLNRLIRCVCGKKIGPDPRNFNQRVSLGRNDLLIRTFHKALAELGKAIKTIFLCRYIGSEDLRIEINEGLNVVENWNSANAFIFYGKGGEVATNRLEEQELSVLALHLLQICLVYVNTLMIQQVLHEPVWLSRMKAEDFRALTPLIYAHVNPYGIFELDMETRLPIDVVA